MVFVLVKAKSHAPCDFLLRQIRAPSSRGNTHTLKIADGSSSSSTVSNKAFALFMATYLGIKHSRPITWNTSKTESRSTCVASLCLLQTATSPIFYSSLQSKAPHCALPGLAFDFLRQTKAKLIKSWQHCSIHHDHPALLGYRA